jgi:acyl-CoA synthetase (AMP-forming)/AMP-acid ligase II
LRYWRNEEATRETIVADGWLKTGDVARCDERGYFWLVDRKKVSMSSFTASRDSSLMALGIDQSKRTPSCTCRA